MCSPDRLGGSTPPGRRSNGVWPWRNALCAAQGDRHREAALENNLADLHHAAGRTEESMAHLKRAVAIFADIGGDEATPLPEVWKLVSW